MQFDNIGVVLQNMAVFNFIVCLMSDQLNLYLVLWKVRNFCHFRCKRIRFLNRDPIMTSNIVAHRKDDGFFIIFGVENICVIYRYEEELLEISKLKNADLLSNIMVIESDRVSHSLFLVLENREIWRLDLDGLAFTQVTVGTS